MSNLSTNLKPWGSTGSAYPDGYNYLEGEQPVDSWDNHRIHHTIKEIHALQSVVNDRLESNAASSHPSSPEVGHLSHRTDGPGPTNDEELYHYDNGASSWRRLLTADGPILSGNIDTNGYSITNSVGAVPLPGGASVQNATLDDSWFRNHDGGSVADGSLVPIGTFAVEDGETLEVSQATLTEDGFTTPAASGIDLKIVPDWANSEGNTVPVLQGDGSTLFDDESGDPLASWPNASGSHETVILAIDNGHFNAGTGSTTQAFASYIARVV